MSKIYSQLPLLLVSGNNFSTVVITLYTKCITQNALSFACTTVVFMILLWILSFNFINQNPEHHEWCEVWFYIHLSRTFMSLIYNVNSWCAYAPIKGLELIQKSNTYLHPYLLSLKQSKHGKCVKSFFMQCWKTVNQMNINRQTEVGLNTGTRYRYHNNDLSQNYQ
jgi:hypothetical protein